MRSRCCPSFAGDPDRLSRFEREARLLASLNRPNIGSRAFVGETTTDVLAKIVEREPDWSALPQGISPTVLRLIYPSGEGQEAVWLRRADGSATQLTLEGNARDPGPSGDGTRISYISGPRYAQGQIWMRALDGSKAQQICPGFTATFLAASPDGSSVAFTTTDTHRRTHLWSAVVDNSVAPREIVGGDTDHLNPRFGPDGRTVFYVERRQEGVNRVACVNVDGTGWRALTDWEPTLQLGSVSPDGQWLSVIRGCRTPREAWLFPADNNGAPRKLWNTWALAWASGNGAFVYRLPLAR